MTSQAKLSATYQITIPKVIRETQKWEAGQIFVFLPNGKGVLLLPAPRLSDLRGSRVAQVPRIIEIVLRARNHPQ